MTSNSTSVKDLTAEIAEFYDVIVEKVADLRLETQQSMAKIKEEHQELTSQLQQNLAQGESLRMTDFQKFMREVIEQRKARETEVMAMLAQYQQEEQMITIGFKKPFRDSRQARLRDFKQFIAETRLATVDRKAEIAEIKQMSMDIRKSARETIARFREEQEERARSWKAASGKSRKNRPQGIKPGPKASATIMLDSEKIQKKGARNTKSEPKAPELTATLAHGEE